MAEKLEKVETSGCMSGLLATGEIYGAKRDKRKSVMGLEHFQRTGKKLSIREEKDGRS